LRVVSFAASGNSALMPAGCPAGIAIIEVNIMPEYIEFLMNVWGMLLNHSFTGDIYGTFIFWVGVWAVTHIAINIVDRII